MKTTINILKFLCLVLVIAISIPIVSDYITSNLLPELIGMGSVSYASLLVLPTLSNNKSLLSSLELREKRGDIYKTMKDLSELAKSESRDLTKDEERTWNELNNEFEKLTQKLDQVEIEEQRAAQQAMKNFMKANGSSITESNENWIDTRTGEKIPVFSKGESILDITSKEQRNFSIGRAIQALVKGDWSSAPNEQRALSTAVGSGSVLVPVGLMPNVIDVVRNRAVCYAAGAKHVIMPTEKVTIARILTDPTMEVKAQNDAFTEGSMTFDKIELSAFTVGTVMYISRELAADAPNCVAAIENAIINALITKIDALALYGVGTTEPLGLKDLVGTEVVDLNSAATLGYDHLIDAWTKLASKGAECSAYIVSPRDLGAITKERTANGYLVAPSMLTGKILHTNSVPVNLGATQDESIAFAGDFSRMLIGMREQMMFEVSTTAGDTFAKHQVAIKITWRGDVAFEQPSHFAKIVDISAPV